ncbi:hypothetical protein DFH09DRAFT_1204041 [Mycena vulgaris]|nr:hypothetical protein DFH09DRAFT_1209878 [Mycena vulgaris]KAJ6498293.1 hypothetical protein DFH09DRAFT_1204041 [Mycena vulgaris]
MSNCHCHVCLSDFPINDFRRLGCGHCFCRRCIARVDRCPECRASIAVGDPQPIYLHIVASIPLETVVADGISLMDESAKLISVRTAAKKLKQVADQQRRDARALESLLVAIDDFNERIIPMFTKIKSQDTEIGTLKTQLAGMDELKALAEKVTPLNGEVAMLRAEGLALKKELKGVHEELKMAKVAKGQALELNRKAQDAEAEAQGEIRRLKGFLETNSDDRATQRNKMQCLQQEKDALERQVEELRTEIRDIRSSGYTDLDVEEEIFVSEYSTSSPASSQSIRRSHITSSWQTQDPLPAREFEGMPRPGFRTDWQLNRGTKRKERETETPRGFPITLSHGRTTVAVQLGPKHTRRVKAK